MKKYKFEVSVNGETIGETKAYESVIDANEETHKIYEKYISENNVDAKQAEVGLHLKAEKEV